MLFRSELIQKLIIVDMAPVTYSHHHQEIINGLKSLNPERFSTRMDLDHGLSAYIPDKLLRQFLLKNIVRTPNGFDWRINLSAIDENYADIMDAAINDQTLSMPALFIKGENSDYITSKGEAKIHEICSNVKIETIPESGHWVHSEQPEAFFKSVIGFLT